MKIDFDPDKHEYRIDGKVVPSVTHICRILNYDVADGNNNKWLRDYAADRGSRVHAYTAAIDYGEELDEVDADCAGYVEAYIRFLRDFKPDWTGIERIVGNERARYAGTLDRMGYMEDRAVLIDIKTGAKLNHAYCAAQLILYDRALSDMGEAEARERLVLQLSRDGTYKLYDVSDAGGDLADACMVIHKHSTFKGELL